MAYIRKKIAYRNLKSGRKMYVYYEEVESHRVNGEVVKTFIKHLGSEVPKKYQNKK